TAFCIRPRQTRKVSARLTDERAVRDDWHILALACVEHHARSAGACGQPNRRRWSAELQPAELPGRESLGLRAIDVDLAVNRIEESVVRRWQVLFEDGAGL